MDRGGQGGALGEAATGLVFEEPVWLAYPDKARDVPLGREDVPEGDLAPFVRRTRLRMPQLSEPELVRHFVRLSQWNYAIESGFYPLGSCTMKHNPRLHETIAGLPGFAELHPEQDDDDVQGLLRLLKTLEELLAEITGMDAVSLQPAAGAHGELVGLLLIRAALDARGERGRTVVLVPDSAHGTNPASAALAGMEVVEIPSGPDGRIAMEAFLAQVEAVRERLAALMLTNPNTAGVFEAQIREICAAVHEAGGFVYGDGANLNALVGVAKPGALGIDCLHINVHKTFSTPHGGGGPGAGPLAVNEALAPFLPTPRIEKIGDRYRIVREDPSSIGPMLGSLGHVGVLLRALAYILAHGREHLHRIAEDAVLAANYIAARLKDHYEIPFPLPCKHEVLLTDARQRRQGITALDIAKRLIDYGFHPMTIYFPLIVRGAMLIEPTETESKETLDRFCDAMIAIAEEVEAGRTEAFKAAPHFAFRTRLDETRAARKPVLVWPEEERWAD
ncbi:MAG: glycine dehydrogenase subunit 2 [Zetaproteobacteria bacterium]|nr:MAG: glycine dehydrogenase subunit 2 [Zetaproteobacteria bacterium]